MKRNNKKFFLRILRLVVILGVPICLFLIWRLEPLLVRNIVVTTDYDLKTKPGIAKILEETKGKNLLSLNTDQLAQTIKSQDIKIKEVSIQKKFPGEISVKIVKRQPLAVIFQGNDFFVVDKDGLVISQEKDAGNLPVINQNLGLQNLKVGSSIDSKNKIIFLILEALSGKEKVITATNQGSELELKLAGGTLIIFPFEESSEEKLASLQLLLTRFRIEGREPVKIDLRFDKPVISF